jgi:phosphomannomutase / phosphoglucomutase
MNPQIFREYDIRGIAGQDITEDDAQSIGKAYGTLIQKHGNKKVSIGRDCRLTSELFSKSFISGVLSTGCDVVDIGLCPTPVLYFSIVHCPTQGGAMITASHNPAEYNGFKLMNGSESIHSQGLQDLRKIIETEDYAKGNGKKEEADILTPYMDYLIKNISIDKGIKIAVDAGNGTGAITALPVLKKLGCKVSELFCKPDGSFPNHPADPTVKSNMLELIDFVKTNKLDLGVGYDGDADRIGIVDKTGELIYGDQLMVVFAREILSRKPGATFISEVKCSLTMYNDIEKHGGKAIMWKTGHSLIKKKMKEENAALAGEMSGHMFFADRYFGFDDALYATLRLLEILCNEKKTVCELISDLPDTYNTPEIRVECAEEVKFEAVKKICNLYKQKANVIDIDGMRVVYDDGWGLVRASNTQPSLVLRFEATSQARLDQIRKDIENNLNEIIKTIS